MIRHSSLLLAALSLVSLACGSTVQELGTKRSPATGTDGGAAAAEAVARPDAATIPIEAGPSWPNQACPNVRPASTAVAVASESECADRSIGAWAFCSGEKRYTGTGALPAMWNGADGVEFRRDASNRWVFEYLKKNAQGALQPDTTLPGHGWVEFVTTGSGNCDLILKAEDGVSDAYIRFQFFENPAAFRNFVYDIYDFVRVSE